MTHTISILVENEFGVLARVAGMFSGRGFNIDSLCVAETMDPEVSRVTIVTKADARIVEQIEKQLNTINPDGENVIVLDAMSEEDEAEKIVTEIRSRRSEVSNCR